MRSETYVKDTPEYVGDTLSFGDIDEVLLICHGASTPSAHDWCTLLNRLRSADYRVILVSTDGGGPNHAQREALLIVLNENESRPPPVAVLSASFRMRWLYAAQQVVSAELLAVTLPFHALTRARRFLEFSPDEKRVQIARDRAHYLLMKRASVRTASHAR